MRAHCSAGPEWLCAWGRPEREIAGRCCFSRDRSSVCPWRPSAFGAGLLALENFCHPVEECAPAGLAHLRAAGAFKERALMGEDHLSAIAGWTELDGHERSGDVLVSECHDGSHHDAPVLDDVLEEAFIDERDSRKG